MNKNKLNAWLTGVTGSMVLIAAILSFMLSFNVLKGEAAYYGVQSNLSALIPLILDGLVLYFGLYIIWAGANKKNALRWLGRSVVVAATILSVILNYSHAQEHALSKVYFTVPPIVLAISLLSLEYMIEHYIHQALDAQTWQDKYELLHGRYTEAQQVITTLRGENTLLLNDVQHLTEYKTILQSVDGVMLLFLKANAGLIEREQLPNMVDMDKRTITKRMQWIEGS